MEAGSSEESASNNGESLGADEPRLDFSVAQLNRVSTAPQSVSEVIPPHSNGMRIGLLGGSFNPPHVAHRAVSLFAIKRLKLDRVWWLVTPGNPLKDLGGLRDLDESAEARRQMARDPRLH